MDENSLPTSLTELDRQLQMLADRGLIGRFAGTAAEPVFDTVPEPHSHMVFEETGQIVDLHVSPETLLAVVRQALAEQSGRVEILVRIRGASGTEPAASG